MLYEKYALADDYIFFPQFPQNNNVVIITLENDTQDT